METVLPFLARSEELFKNVDFIYLFASLIVSEVRADRSNLAGEEWVGCCGWYPGNVTNPVLQTTCPIGDEGGRSLCGGRKQHSSHWCPRGGTTGRTRDRLGESWFPRKSLFLLVRVPMPPQPQGFSSQFHLPYTGAGFCMSPKQMTQLRLRPQASPKASDWSVLRSPGCLAAPRCISIRAYEMRAPGVEVDTWVPWAGSFHFVQKGTVIAGGIQGVLHFSQLQKIVFPCRSLRRTRAYIAKAEI